MGRRGTRRQTAQPSQIDWRDTWTEGDKKRLEILETGIVEPPVWADIDTMIRLGIEPYVTRMLRDMGLGRLHHVEYPAYIEPTLHFAASVKIDYTAGPPVERLKMTFRLFSETYRFTAEDLTQAFGFAEGDDEAYERVPRPNHFWKTMACTEWNSANAKNYDIRNPAVRYVARLLANTMGARKDARKVKVDELAMLYRGLSRHLDAPELFGDGVSNAAVFITDFVSFRDRLSRRKGNSISFGGMLTPLFRYLDIDLSSYTKVPKCTKMDVPYLAASYSGQGIDAISGLYMHNFRMHDEIIYTCQLPLIGLTEPSTEANIAFILPPHLYTVAPPVRKFGQSAGPAVRRAHMRGGRDRHQRPAPEESDEEINPEDAIAALGDEPLLPSPPHTEREERFCEHLRYQNKIVRIFSRAFRKVRSTTRQMRDRISCLENALRDAGIPNAASTQPARGEAAHPPHPTVIPDSTSSSSSATQSPPPRRPQRHVRGGSETSSEDYQPLTRRRRTGGGSTSQCHSLVPY